MLAMNCKEHNHTSGQSALGNVRRFMYGKRAVRDNTTEDRKKIKKYGQNN